jgi:hypothetical protein
MAYPDPQFNAPAQESVVGTPNNPVSAGTTTASGTNSFAVAAGTGGNGAFVFPKWVNPTKVNSIRVYVGTAPASNVTGLLFTFLNGTNTVGSALIGTNAANTTVDATLASNTFGSTGALTSPTIFTTTNGQMGIVITGTGTASAQALGSYAIDLVLQNWFTT